MESHHDRSSWDLCRMRILECLGGRNLFQSTHRYIQSVVQSDFELMDGRTPDLGLV